MPLLFFFFFFNDTATTEIYTLSLHDALPILGEERNSVGAFAAAKDPRGSKFLINGEPTENKLAIGSKGALDRKSTRLNSSHSQISYAVFCLKKKKIIVHSPHFVS